MITNSEDTAEFPIIPIQLPKLMISLVSFLYMFLHAALLYSNCRNEGSFDDLLLS
jgi:hypothetical protein